MYYFVNNEKHCQVYTCPKDFIVLYLFVLTFATKLKVPIIDIVSLKYLVFCDHWEMMSDLNISQEFLNFSQMCKVWFRFIFSVSVHFTLGCWMNVKAKIILQDVNMSGINNHRAQN